MEREGQTMNITYEKCGDYLIPNLVPDSEPEGELRKFGLMRKTYLKEYKEGIYTGLVLSGELKKYLLMVQEEAEKMFDLLMEQMAEREETTKRSKVLATEKEEMCAMLKVKKQNCSFA